MNPYIATAYQVRLFMRDQGSVSRYTYGTATMSLIHCMFTGYGMELTPTVLGHSELKPHTMEAVQMLYAQVESGLTRTK
jgi:hypothetical protein